MVDRHTIFLGREIAGCANEKTAEISGEEKLLAFPHTSQLTASKGITITNTIE
jgi:hypothetical protein